jgi:hypothetical protein
MIHPESPGGGQQRPEGDDLGRALAGTRAAMNARATPDFATRVRARLEDDARRPVVRARFGLTGKALRGAFAAAILVVVVVTAGVGAGLGLPDLPFRLVQPLASPSIAVDVSGDARRLELGDETSLVLAQRDATFPLLVPAELDPPNHVFVADLGGEIMVSFLFDSQSNLPPTRDGHFGALLTEVPGAVEKGLMTKLVSAGATLTPIKVNGDRGYWISGGPQMFMFHDPKDPSTAFDIPLAGDALIWESNRVIYRLESGLSLPANVALAEDMVAPVR